MIDLQIEIDQLEALLDHLKSVERSPLLDVTYKALLDAHTDAAEEYWTQIWSY